MCRNSSLGLPIIVEDCRVAHNHIQIKRIREKITQRFKEVQLSLILEAKEESFSL